MQLSRISTAALQIRMVAGFAEVIDREETLVAARYWLVTRKLSSSFSHRRSFWEVPEAPD
jgi:hypothetical protein